MYSITNVSPPVRIEAIEIDCEDVMLRFMLGKITPRLVQERVREENRLELIDKIRRAVPGYGPH